MEEEQVFFLHIFALKVFVFFLVLVKKTNLYTFYAAGPKMTYLSAINIRMLHNTHTLFYYRNPFVASQHS